MWPQITWLILAGIGLGVNLIKHGEPRKGKVDFWTHGIGLIAGATLLYFGGFFAPLFG